MPPQQFGSSRGFFCLVVLAAALLCPCPSATAQSKQLEVEAVPTAIDQSPNDLRFRSSRSYGAQCGRELPAGQSGHLSFLAIGDWGCRRNRNGGVDGQQQTVATAMFNSGYNPQFVMALGDNFYEHGIKSIKDHRWHNVYERVYNHPVTDKRWYAIVGNHDWRAGTVGIQAQVDYTQVDPSKRWCMPFTYYQQSITVDKGVVAHFIFLDTTKIIDGDPAQLQWLAKALSESKAQWEIVVGHHPIISGSDHGNIPEMLERVYPVINKYNVDLYVAGHDHVLEYLKDGDVHYYVCGSGCKLGSMQTTPGQLIYGKAELGFCGFDITKDEIKGALIGSDSKKRNEAAIPRRRA